MRLLRLPKQGRLALDFEESDEPKIVEAIALCFGGLDVAEALALGDVLEIGGARLLHYTEWDPCLIALDAAGDTVLLRLAAALGISPPA